MQARVYLLVSVLCVIFVSSCAIKCNRVPEDAHAPKSMADGRFEIRISGNPDKYVPGGTYTVSLQGQRVGKFRATFKRFMLVVEPSYSYLSSWENSAFGDRNVGTLELYGDNIAKHSTDCPNAITQTSILSKSQIVVSWTAPPPGSGCIVFRATVVEDYDVWYMDDGALSLLLCEDVQEESGVEETEFVYPCCACDDAMYQMTFEGLWSKQTHPKEFPPNEWLTGFSELIGGTHSAGYRFWEYGNFASEGLRQVAELGDAHILETEIMAEREQIRTIIKARGLAYPNLPGKTYAIFRADTKHHLMSIVSKIDPSPDWIVGISGLNLCLRNCSWVDYKVLNLYPWDVGTDSGITYTASDEPTSSRQTISRITPSFPNDPRSPFYDPSGAEMWPMARLYLIRQKLYEKRCDNKEVEASGNTEENQEKSEPYCAVSEWSEWSYCSVTCGRGVRHRHRSYLDTKKAYFMSCNEMLAEHDKCYAAQRTCSSQSTNGYNNNNWLEDPTCAVTSWSSWSSCSVTCGTGEMTRTRRYKSRHGYKRCSAHPDAPLLKETTECNMSDDEDCETEVGEAEEVMCPDTEWSAWSPCSTSCGKGKSTRVRLPTGDQESEEEIDCPEVHMTEERDCMADIPSCEITPQVYRAICEVPLDEGACSGTNKRWYFDSETKTCTQFTYTGCQGNKNNFLTEEECNNICKGYIPPEGEEEEDTTMIGPFNGLLPSSQILDLNTNTYGLLVSTLPTFTFEEETEPVTAVDGPVVNCVVSRWTRWSKCSVSCGDGYKTRSRTIVVHPRNGGVACPQKLYKKRKCKKSCKPELEDSEPELDYYRSRYSYK